MNFYLKMKGKFYYIIKSLLVLTLLLMFLIPVSCSINSNGYQKAIITKGGVRLSFEYPLSYQDTNKTLNSNLLKHSFLLKRVDANNTSDNSDTKFTLFIINPSEFRPDAKAEIDEYQKTVESTNPSVKYKLLERSKINVAGVEGEMISYSATYEIPQFFIVVFFDYKGMRWNLNFDALDTVSENVKAEFDHIIRSIKFLD
jgi:hypothetical protein